MAAKKPELVDVLLCDDVRRENDGRFSLMGVRPGLEVETPQLPTVINQFALVLRLRGIAQGDRLQLAIRAPDGKDAKPVLGRPLEPATAAGEALFVVQAAPVQFSVPGEHQVLVRVGKDVFKRAFRVVQPA